MARQFGGAVSALVVDQHDRKVPRIVLPQQRADRIGNAIGLVARRHDRDDLRPRLRRAARQSRARPASQKSPRAAIRYIQIASAVKATRSTNVCPACCYGLGRPPL